MSGAFHSNYFDAAGVLTAKPRVIPVYVDIDVEVAEGLVTRRCDHDDQWSADQWSALVDMYSRSVCRAEVTAITGYDSKSHSVHITRFTYTHCVRPL